MHSLYDESCKVESFTRLIDCFIRHGRNDESHGSFAQSERACHFVLPLSISDDDVVSVSGLKGLP